MRLNINKLYPTYLLLFFLLPLISFGKKNTPVKNGKSIHLNFHNESIHIIYDDKMLFGAPLQANETTISGFFKKMETAPYQLFLQNLKTYKAKLELNDWLFYELIRVALDELYPQKNNIQKELSSWFLLSKSGYNTRLTYLGNHVFVYTQSDESIFETPMIEENGKTFINLSSIYNHIDTKGALLNILDFTPTSEGKSFSFNLQKLPKFRPIEKTRKLRFQWQNHDYDLNVKFDLNLIKLMENYPILDETQYIQTSLSSLGRTSLVPQFQKIINDKTEKEALEIIAIFTRSAFRYKDDNDYFGKNKPMIADELFHYPYSDCEDRSALFYFLVKKLLHLPMIVIAYDDHLTIAVSTAKPIGSAIRYKDEKYYICDPTGPSNSREIGNPPIGYENKKFEILEIK